MNQRKPEQIVAILHKTDEALAQGKTIEDICREQEISPATYHRWKQKYGGLSIEDAMHPGSSGTSAMNASSFAHGRSG